MKVTAISTGILALALWGSRVIQCPADVVFDKSSPSVTRSHAEEVIYRKSLPDHQVLVATRREVPPTVMLPDMKAWAKSLPPGQSLTSASHRYQYTYTTYTYKLGSSEASPHTLWVHSVDSFESIPPGPTSATRYASKSTSNIVLDALVEGAVLVVVYKQGRAILANVIQPDGHSGISSVPFFDSQLVSDSELMGEPLTVTGATISGSVKADTLAVSLQSLRGSNLQYRRVGGHWTRSN